MQQNDADAVSQTPSDKGKGMQVFFNPAQGICNALASSTPGAGDQGVLNQATLFHESLHGFTAKFDGSFFNLLNPDALLPQNLQTGNSADITYYIMLNVIPGGSQGALACRN